MEIGILAFHGDVCEHAEATRRAAERLGVECGISEVRAKQALEGLDGLILPGGESTTIMKLIEREGMEKGIKAIPKIFGTCAGLVLMSKKIKGGEEGQKTLGLLDVETGRNAFGRQIDSGEVELETKLGNVNAVFIRAPLIEKCGEGVEILAEYGGGAVAVFQESGEKKYLATAFHPELADETAFHEHFLKM